MVALAPAIGAPLLAPAAAAAPAVAATAVTNTDDFLWRLVKGCIQLGLVPNINNTVNMVPVDHVARCCALAAAHPLPAPRNALSVLHVAAAPRPTFNGFLGALAQYGFGTQRSEYLHWRRQLERHVMDVQDNALFPLLHFVLDDLPTKKGPKTPTTPKRSSSVSSSSTLYADRPTVTNSRVKQGACHSQPPEVYM